MLALFWLKSTLLFFFVSTLSLCPSGRWTGVLLRQACTAASVSKTTNPKFGTRWPDGIILDCAIPLLLMRISATYYVMKMIFSINYAHNSCFDWIFKSIVIFSYLAKLTKKRLKVWFCAIMRQISDKKLLRIWIHCGCVISSTFLAIDI